VAPDFFGVCAEVDALGQAGQIPVIASARNDPCVRGDGSVQATEMLVIVSQDSAAGGRSIRKHGGIVRTLTTCFTTVNISCPNWRKINTTPDGKSSSP
jgi:hypothetical protein